ncbi:TPA: aldolase/citrate lyase family protein [Clostridioides difficile]
MLIEQKAGYDKLEEMAKVKGINIIALSPGDLYLDMGFSGYMDRIEIKDMISNTTEICKKYKMPFNTFLTIEKKSIETWVNIGANILYFAQDTPLTYIINQLLSFYNEIVPIKKQH